MNCTFDKEKLTGFFDGELDAPEKAEVGSHISSCSECLRDMGEIKSAALLVRQLPRGRAPRLIAEGVSREVSAAERVHSMARFRRGLLWATSAAAALLIILNVVFFLPQWSGSGRAPEMAVAPGAKVPPAPPRMAKGFLDSQSGAPVRQTADEAGQRDFGNRLKMKKLDDRLVENKQVEGGRRLEKVASEPSATAKPKPKPAPLPPGPRPTVRRRRMAAKESASAAPKPAAKKRLAEADAAVRADRTKTEELARTKDGKASAPAHQYVVLTADVAEARRLVETALKKWNVYLEGGKADKSLPRAQVWKLKAAQPETLEVRLTDSQLALLTKSLSEIEGLKVVPFAAAEAQEQMRIAIAGRSAGSAAPKPKPVAPKRENERKAAEDADERNRVVVAEAEKAVQAAEAPGAAKPPLRRVIFHFRRK